MRTAQIGAGTQSALAAQLPGGRPFDKLIKFNPLAKRNEAVRASKHGEVLKAVGRPR
jgi:hypothetical protein